MRTCSLVGVAGVQVGVFDVAVCCLRYLCDPHQRPQSSCGGQHYIVSLHSAETEGAGCVS